MQGERIELVNRKISSLISNLRKDPCTLDTVYICVASYDMDIKTCLPLTELTSKFDLPVMEAKPSTPSMLGNALFFLDSLFEKTIKMPTAEKKGDYPPALYILTGGKPSDGASAHDAMAQILSKRKMTLCLGLTSSTLVPFYKNLFDFNIPTGSIVITDLNLPNNGCWIDIWRSMNTLACTSVSTSTLLPCPPEKIQINF